MAQKLYRSLPFLFMKIKNKNILKNVEKGIDK